MIVSDPHVMMGKPVVAGTRITVELILEKLASGESIEQVVDAHPRLTREGVKAARGFAAEALRADVVYPVPTAAWTSSATRVWIARSSPGSAWTAMTSYTSRSSPRASRTRRCWGRRTIVAPCSSPPTRISANWYFARDADHRRVAAAPRRSGNGAASDSLR
jgi:uncharacterized protein (DUF433 family)